jgi:hypothetical protein
MIGQQHQIFQNSRGTHAFRYQILFNYRIYLHYTTSL